MSGSKWQICRITVLTLVAGMLAGSVRAEEGKAANGATEIEGAQRQEFLNRLVEKKDAPAEWAKLLPPLFSPV